MCTRIEKRRRLVLHVRTHVVPCGWDLLFVKVGFVRNFLRHNLSPFVLLGQILLFCRKNKNPAPASKFLLGQERYSFLRCHPAWSFRLLPSWSSHAYRHMLVFVDGEPCPGADTRSFGNFPLALGSPFGSALPCCTLTTGNSLDGKESKLTHSSSTVFLHDTTWSSVKSRGTISRHFSSHLSSCFRLTGFY